MLTRAGGAILVVTATLFAGIASADVTLAPILGDGMVLQRGAKAPIWGTAGAGEKVTVTFREKKVEATADKDGKWRADLPAMDAGGPWPMTVAGKNSIELKQVFVGEVWIASGQSNMAMPIKHADGAEQAAKDHLPNLRLCRINYDEAKPGAWEEAHCEAISEFSAVAYWFGKDLAERLKVPVGIIHGAVSGSVIEQWLPPADMQRLKVPKPAEIPNRARGNWRLYDEIIAPLQPYGIRGVIWYQGEGNRGRGDDYAVWFPAMIEGWRREWGQGDFAFLFVQLPRLGQPDTIDGPTVGLDTAPMREAQLAGLKPKNTAMAVYYEASDGDGHTKYKRTCGERLALAARGLVYGEKVEYRAPLFKAARVEGEKLIISFDHAEGLTAGPLPGELKIDPSAAPRPRPRSGAPAAVTATQPAADVTSRSTASGPSAGVAQPPSAVDVTDLYILAADNSVLRGVSAKVVGETVVVDLTGQASQAAWVYYAWRNYPRGNLSNAAGLPASPFRAKLSATSTSAPSPTSKPIAQ